MRHHDLGVRNGAILLFGGPYSNAQALAAVADVAIGRGMSGADMICTGDVVAYCGDPSGTVASVMRLGINVVAGNCEIQLARRAPDCGCGFEVGSACDLLSAGWYPFADARISAAQRDWMGSLPDILTFTHQGARYGVIHGGVTDVARFIWSTTPAEVLEAEWQAAEAAVGPLDHIICGHSGIAFIRATRKGRWINAGVIGIPPHDGGQQTRYGILDGAEIAIHRLNYDVQGAVKDMENAGLAEPYRGALTTGYWPSEDVLPEDLRLPSFASG